MTDNSQSGRNPGRTGDKTLVSVLRIMDNRYLHSIRHGFTLVMPIMIIGSLAILINNFPVPQYQEMMERIWGEDWTRFGQMVYAGTFSIISLVVCLSISAQLTVWYVENKGINASPLLSQIICFCCVIVTINFTDGDISFTDVAGVNGLFLTILITLVSTEIFLRLCMLSRRIFPIVYTGEASDSVPAAMNAIMPSLITIALFVTVRLLFGLVGIDNLNAGLNRLMQMPFDYLKNTTLTAVIFSFSTHLMWLLGIHGNNVLDNVAQNLYTAAMNENIAAVAAGSAAPNLFTKSFFDAFVYTGGSGATICLIIAILIFGKRSGAKRLSRISLPFGIFNINEPMMYGLPIVLNPVYILPFLLTPILNTLTTAAAMTMGLVPYTVQETVWTTVLFVSGYTATGGSVAAVILQLFNLVMGVCIYAPFVYLADKMENRRFVDSVIKLGVHAQSYSPDPGKRLIGLGGNVGAVARQLGNDLSSRSEYSTGGELYLLYQPIVDAKSGTVFGYETLLRWRHPVYGAVSPMVAIALAEDIGAIGRLGLWILDTSLKELAGFRKRGLSRIIQYANISLRQLAEPDFAQQVEKLLSKHGVPPEFLRLEITESVALSLATEVKENIDRLNAAGIQLALDDFGMGHSSLSYLKVFPSTTVKIDESLTNIESGSATDLNMLKSIVGMCADLDIDLIAERVETKEQLDALIGAGCRLIQGFYFSKPLSAQALEEFVHMMEPRQDGGPG